MKALKPTGFLISLLLFLSSCENIWTLPSLLPCEAATLCEIESSESHVYTLERGRVGHHSVIVNVFENQKRVLTTGGTLEQDTVLFLSTESIPINDTGGPSETGEPSFIDSRSMLQFPFNAVVSDWSSKKAYVVGGINTELLTLDLPFNMNEIETSQLSTRLSIYDGKSARNIWNLENLEVGRAGHTTTFLSSTGEIVLLGGNHIEGEAEIYNTNTSSSTFSTTSMSVNRCFHTANLLNNQKIAIVGGMSYSSGQTTNVIETYNINTNSFEEETVTGSDFAARMGHTANHIGNEKLLIVGGQNEMGFHDEIFIYNSAEKIMERVDSLPIPMAYHTATTLSSGWVLMAGGRSVNSAQNSLLIFKPVEEELFELECSLTHARYGHSVTLVDDSDLTKVKLLVIGGRNIGGAVLQSEMLSLNLVCLEL